jgi:phytoene synthase
VSSDSAPALSKERPQDQASLREAYRLCRQVTRERAKNFYYAFIVLPPAKRSAIYAAYAFSRRCDDATDDDIPLQEKMARLDALRLELDRSLSGDPSDPVFLALSHMAHRYRIPRDYFHAIIDGVAADLTVRRYETFQELRDYCYNVASVVGLLCIEIFGYRDPRAKEYAVDVGLAMQLTNVLRDLKEDTERGRIYLPLEELRRFQYTPEELLQGTINDRFLALMRFQAQRAKEHFQQGRRLLPLLSPRSRACVAVLDGLYSRILDKIEARQYDVFSERIGLSTAQKLLLVGKVWTRSLLQGPARRPRPS